MKRQYEEILSTTAGGYRIEVKRNSSKFIVKVAKAEMKNFDKKAPPAYFKDRAGILNQNQADKEKNDLHK